MVEHAFILWRRHTNSFRWRVRLWFCMWLRRFMGTRIPGVRGHGRLEVCKGPWSLRRSRGYAPHVSLGLMAGYAACCTQYIRHFPLVHVQRWFIVKTQGRTLDCPFNFLPPRSVAGWFLSVRPMRAKRSQVNPTSGDPGVAKAPFGASRRVSCRDPALPVEGPDVAVAAGSVTSFDPGTWLQGAAEWCNHSSQAGTSRKGDQPKDWRAPSQETALPSGIPASLYPSGMSESFARRSLLSAWPGARWFRWATSPCLQASGTAACFRWTFLSSFPKFSHTRKVSTSGTRALDKDTTYSASMLCGMVPQISSLS